MASRPTHHRWILFTAPATIVVVASAWLAFLRASPWLWILTAVIAITFTSVGLVLRSRGIEAARERAWTGSAFKGVVERMRVREAAETLADERRAALFGSAHPNAAPATHQSS
jgi:hypothetical protein